MHTVVGLVLLGIFVPCVVALAAGVTWIVVKVSPAPSEKKSA